MTSRIEKVARAIATEDWRRHIDEFSSPEDWAHAVEAYDLTNNNGRFVFDGMARAAIAAMRESTEAMADKIEGLEADLDSAVEVAYRHGATEWVRMNYPTRYAALAEKEG